MQINLTEIPLEEKSYLETLLKDYLQEITPESTGEYKYIDAYWQKPTHYPYWIIVGKEIVGFVLINDYTIVTNNAKSISEFYIKQEFRGKGVGAKAVKLILELFPGVWEIRALESNQSAQQFWQHVLSKQTKHLKQIDMDSQKWHGGIWVIDVKN